MNQLNARINMSGGISITKLHILRGHFRGVICWLEGSVSPRKSWLSLVLITSCLDITLHMFALSEVI